MSALVWYDAVPRPGWQQMAIDRALAERATVDGTVVYRLYRWEEDTVSFGANESASRTWTRSGLERAQVPCVRRPTGGRGVWHDGADLTYAVTGPLAALGGLRLAYRLIHEQLAAALRGLGLDAGVAAPGIRPATLDPGACFDTAIGGEVLVAGRKTIGSAQAVFGTAMLQHGAIARMDRSASLARFRLNSGPSDEREPGPELPSVEALAGAVLAAWQAAGGSTAPPELRRSVEVASADHTDRFQDHEWTWRR